MFSINCPRHGSTVLLGLSDIDRINNGGDAIDVHYTCSCGHRGVWRTGRKT